MKLALLSVNFTVFSAKHLYRASRSVFFALVSFCLLFNGATVSAQSSEKPRATKVSVAKVTTDTISEFSVLQGRLVAGAIEAVTAVTTAKIEILDLELGDFVSRGQHIAKQNAVKLVSSQDLLRAELAETIIQYDDMAAEIESERALLEIAKQRTALLDRKAARAEDLATSYAERAQPEIEEGRDPLQGRIVARDLAYCDALNMTGWPDDEDEARQPVNEGIWK